jgi:hypothetical protein
MAKYIGALLFVVLTFVEITAMFFEGPTKLEIINNAFLRFWAISLARAPVVL